MPDSPESAAPCVGHPTHPCCLRSPSPELEFMGGCQSETRYRDAYVRGDSGISQ
jgi:hypothetical protein